MSLQADKQTPNITCYTMVNIMNRLMVMLKRQVAGIFCSCSVQHTQHTRHMICTQYADSYFGNIYFLHSMCLHACSYAYFEEKCYKYKYLFTVDYVMTIQVRTQIRANPVRNVDIWDRP
jgi:hypothetical protein